MIRDKIRNLFIKKRDKKLLSRKEQRYVRDAKALALAGLEIVDYNDEKLARLLNINLELLENILKERAVLTKHQIDKIRTNFAKNIALYDSLSSLESKMNIRATLYNLTENCSISLVFITVKEFKEFNEKYGYETSDEILQMAASRVSNSYPCAYMTRLKKDKFCLIFPNKNKYQAKQLLRDLNEVLTNEYNLELSGVKVTPNLKINAINYPEDVKTIDEVIKLTKS